MFEKSVDISVIFLKKKKTNGTFVQMIHVYILQILKTNTLR